MMLLTRGARPLAALGGQVVAQAARPFATAVATKTPRLQKFKIFR